MRAALRIGLKGINRLLRPSGFELSRPADPFPDVEPKAKELRRRLAPFTMTSEANFFALCAAVDYVSRRGIPGAFVECGVWRGGSSMGAALMFQRLSDIRDIHLFDTFEGMPPASDRDKFIATGMPAEFSRAKVIAATGTYVRADEAEVRSNMASTGYDPSRVFFHRGMVEETLPREAPDTIAILRLDTDWYASTKHELGEAVNECFAANPQLLFRVDYSARMAVKLPPQHNPLNSH